jgi:hypothetical protein
MDKYRDVLMPLTFKQWLGQDTEAGDHCLFEYRGIRLQTFRKATEGISHTENRVKDVSNKRQV